MRPPSTDAPPNSWLDALAEAQFYLCDDEVSDEDAANDEEEDDDDSANNSVELAN